MPPSPDDPRPNPINGAGDYTTTSVVHSDTYASISPSNFSSSTGKSVLISGASKGIGRATAISFAQSGATNIAITARSSLDSLVDELRAAAKAAGRSEPKILALKVDITDQKSVSAAKSEVEREFGRLDVLVNNAGIMNSGMIAEMDGDDWWKVWETNIKGTYLVCHTFLPLMLEKGGDKTIVTVSSVGAHIVMPSLSAYQISKLAQLRFMEFVNAEYGDKGILAYCVHPGNVADTAIMGGEEIPDDLKHIFVDTPQLAGDTMAFLTKEKRDWLAGRYINVTWDMPDLMSQEKVIAGTDKLKVRMVLP